MVENDIALAQGLIRKAVGEDLDSKEMNKCAIKADEVGDVRKYCTKIPIVIKLSN